MRRLAGADTGQLRALLAGYGLDLREIPAGQPIPASYWGESEAGLEGATLFARPDTPLHSILHETAHYVCMSGARRSRLRRDAGGDEAEETAVCYLQVLLADALRGVGSACQLADMDAWGYSFRLGAAAEWFRRDAEDARAWLVAHGIIAADGTLTGRLRW